MDASCYLALIQIDCMCSLELQVVIGSIFILFLRSLHVPLTVNYFGTSDCKYVVLFKFVFLFHIDNC